MLFDIELTISQANFYEGNLYLIFFPVLWEICIFNV